MDLPFFYEETLPLENEFLLSEESSRHIVQVLRMKNGENILLTNGNGETLKVKILDGNKKKTMVAAMEKKIFAKPYPTINIAIGLIKNKNRFEWFVEKVTEIGVTGIFPIITSRTEKQSFNIERIKSIAISAMLQSQQSWLSKIHEPVKFDRLVKSTPHQQKFIAYCGNDEKQTLSNQHIQSDSLILIGPEGDFTPEEVSVAKQNNFIPVSLGETRLRTETAGVVAAVLCKLGCK